MGSGVKRIIEQAYHRNGIGGAPAVVTLFEAYGYSTPFVAITVFPDRPENPVWFETEVDAKRRDFVTHTVVLKVDETAKGNITFGSGNSWYGSDQYGPDIARAWQEKCRAEGYDPFDESWEPEAETVTT